MDSGTYFGCVGHDHRKVVILTYKSTESESHRIDSNDDPVKRRIIPAILPRITK